MEVEDEALADVESDPGLKPGASGLIRRAEESVWEPCEPMSQRLKPKHS